MPSDLLFSNPVLLQSCLLYRALLYPDMYFYLSENNFSYLDFPSSYKDKPS